MILCAIIAGANSISAIHKYAELKFEEDTYCITATTLDKGHGRIEERQVAVTNNLDWLEVRGDWTDIKSMIRVTSIAICCLSIPTIIIILEDTIFHNFPNNISALV